MIQVLSPSPDSALVRWDFPVPCRDPGPAATTRVVALEHESLCRIDTRQRKPRCPLIVRQATCRRADGAVQLLPLRRHTVRSLARGTTGDAQRRTLRQSLPNGVQPAAGVFGLLCFAVLH